ncbi:MAG: aldehyde ferredoxin oxidoreductase N-terminal domain-containing protein [Thermoguttaceae bacterium]
MNGYAGKILRINLTSRQTTTMPTSRYEEWVGGHGMGSAIFFDLVPLDRLRDKTIDGFDPANVVTMMTSPLSGTLVPAGAGRTEVQGIGVQSYPIGWFTRSNFGGRFSTMLKSAGWDGIVLEGKADRPVWLDIRDGQVEIRDCTPLSLWGQDTWQCQETIWKYVADGQDYGGWIDPGGEIDGQTTQRPAVVAIGPAGENLSRMACLIHDASNGSGQGGFGAVWGSKNLKAVSVIGTGTIDVNDPKALIEARLWQKKHYAFDLSRLKGQSVGTHFMSPPVGGQLWKGRPTERQRPQACVGCHSGCRARYESGLGNEASCYTTVFYANAKSLEIQRKASDLLNRYGLNAHEMTFVVFYIRDLAKRGILGPGKKIDCPFDLTTFGSLEFVQQLIKAIAYRNDGRGGKSQFGDDLAEGCMRAAKRWGRLEEDLRTGQLPFPHWGIPIHRDPRAQLEWGYGTILGDRDINEHDFDWLHWQPTNAKLSGRPMQIDAEEAIGIYTKKMVPFQDDPLMLDYGTENMYSEHIAKLVAWHRYYTRFWKQSALFCDWRWPDFINVHAPDNTGSTGEAEPKFLKAVTGKDFSFLDGIELGRRIWNLDHAIWTLQGRHRDMVHFAEFIYNQPMWGPTHCLPGRKDGKWVYFDTVGRKVDKQKFEEFKTAFYRLQGWDETTGYPNRNTLESMQLGYVADELEKNDTLGKG